MSCTLNSILAGADNACEESFSGVGTRIYIGLVSDLTIKPTKDDVDETTAEFKPTCFSTIKGKLHAYDIEEETGEITSEANAGGGGFNNKIEFTIRKNMHKVAHDLRVLNNVKFFCFVPAAVGYYVFYSVNGSAKLDTLSSTTGKAATDEHGHTITISASPMYYPDMTWVPTETAEGATTATAVDLDDWCADLDS